MTRHLIVLTLIVITAATAGAQPTDPVDLLCTDNRATFDGRPWGPMEIKFRISYRARTVEVLRDDGRVIAVDRDPEITTRTIKWGVGNMGKNTWKQLGLSYNVSSFDGTIDRESGSVRAIWTPSSVRGREYDSFAGVCRISTIKF